MLIEAPKFHEETVQDFREISSSFPRPTPAFRPAPGIVATIPSHAEDMAFTIAVEALRALQQPRRNAIINFLSRWLELPPGRQAGLALAVMPELTPGEIAVLCGKSARQIDRYEEYRALKPTLEDYLESKRRSSVMPDEITD